MARERERERERESERERERERESVCLSLCVTVQLISTYPDTGLPEKVWFGHGAHSGLLVKVDRHATVVSHLHPALWQHLKVIATLLCVGIRR